MSETNKPDYIVREMRVNDGDQVRDIWLSNGFDLVYKYGNEVMALTMDPKGVLVAEDTTTGKYIYK